MIEDQECGTADDGRAADPDQRVGGADLPLSTCLQGLQLTALVGLGLDRLLGLVRGEREEHAPGEERRANSRGDRARSSKLGPIRLGRRGDDDYRLRRRGRDNRRWRWCGPRRRHLQGLVARCDEVVERGRRREIRDLIRYLAAGGKVDRLELDLELRRSAKYAHDKQVVEARAVELVDVAASLLTAELEPGSSVRVDVGVQLIPSFDEEPAEVLGEVCGLFDEVLPLRIRHVVELARHDHQAILRGRHLGCGDEHGQGGDKDGAANENRGRWHSSGDTSESTRASGRRASIPESRANPILLVEYSKRLVIGLFQVGLFALVTVAAASTHALPIDVIGRTTLAVDGHTIGHELVVSGRATDDLGRGVPFRRVRVEGTSESGRFVAEAVTDPRGSFEVRRVLPSAEWSVTARFVGDLFTEGAEEVLDVEVRPRVVRAALSSPNIVPVSERSAPLTVQVTVGGRPAVGAPVRFESECGAVVGGASVGADGLAHGDFVFGDDAVGECAVVAVVAGQRRFKTARANASMRRIDAPTVRLTGRFERGGPFLDGEWTVDVEAFDRYGTLRGARIDLSRDGVEFASTRVTGPTSAVFRIAEAEIGVSAEIVATLVPDVGELRLSTAPLMLVRPPSPSRVFGFWSVGLASLLGLIIIGGIVREIRRARPQSEARRPAVAGVVEEPAPEMSADMALIVVRDVEDETPIRAVVTRVEDGQRWESGTNGLIELRHFDPFEFTAVADGYVPLRGTISVPRAGRRAVIRLKSVRAEVRDVLRVSLESLRGRESRWWGRRTTWRVTEEAIREARTLRKSPTRAATHRAELARLLALAAEARGEAEALEALALLVDDLYFGGSGELAAVELAHELAAAARGLA